MPTSIAKRKPPPHFHSKRRNHRTREIPVRVYSSLHRQIFTKTIFRLRQANNRNDFASWKIQPLGSNKAKYLYRSRCSQHEQSREEESIPTSTTQRAARSISSKLHAHLRSKRWLHRYIETATATTARTSPTHPRTEQQTQDIPAWKEIVHTAGRRCCCCRHVQTCHSSRADFQALHGSVMPSTRPSPKVSRRLEASTVRQCMHNSASVSHQLTCRRLMLSLRFNLCSQHEESALKAFYIHTSTRIAVFRC